VTCREDLWRPELRGRIAMVDAPREVVGAAAKVAGLSYNTPDLDAGGAMPQVAQRLQQLSTQVKFFSNTDHLKALAAGEGELRHYTRRLHVAGACADEGHFWGVTEERARPTMTWTPC